MPATKSGRPATRNWTGVCAKVSQGNTPRFQRPIEVEVHGLAGKPLTLIARDELGHVAHVDSAMPLVPAEKQPLTTERLREQLGRLGGTPFRLGGLKNRLAGNLLLPVSELNRLRRQFVRELENPARPTQAVDASSAECGVRSAECRWRRHPVRSDLTAIRIPHSAFRN